jgi:NAD(P)-dependent dehydrogenase (short-subunit alcohol dehydrogenase family)
MNSKTVLVTGANKGIGLEVARQMARQEYFVYLGCRDKKRGDEALAGLHLQGLTNTEILELEVTNEDSVQKAFKLLEKKIAALDVLINNAGIRGDVPQNASTAQLSNIRNIFETNFFGVITVTQKFLPLLKKSIAPRIVNVTSDLASLMRHQDPHWQFYKFRPAGYAPSKSALNAYTVMLAKELIDTNFKVNAVNPGHTATDFNNYQGHKKVDEAARVIVTYATLDEDGPTGRFFSEDGETPW